MNNARKPGHAQKPSLFLPPEDGIVDMPEHLPVSSRARASVNMFAPAKTDDYKAQEIKKKLLNLILMSLVSLQTLPHRAADQITQADYKDVKTTFTKLAEHLEPELQQLKTTIETYSNADLLKNEKSVFSKLMPIVESVRNHENMLETILNDQLDAKRKAVFK